MAEQNQTLAPRKNLDVRFRYGYTPKPKPRPNTYTILVT